MKTSLTFGLELTAALTSALPTNELGTRADPDLVPVTFVDNPQHSFTCGTFPQLLFLAECSGCSDVDSIPGSTTYPSQDIYNGVAWGTVLFEDSMTRGSKSDTSVSAFPVNFSLTSLSEAKYPHSFGNTEDIALSSRCKQGDHDMYEYPPKTGTYYNGGNQNKNQGPDRVVFLHGEGETDSVEGHWESIFCGVMTHTGANPSNNFILCADS